MKKSLIFPFLLTACVLVGCSKSHDANNIPCTLTLMGIKGHVMSVTDTCYDAISYSGEIKKGRRISPSQQDMFFIHLYAISSTEFNQDGNAVKETGYHRSKQIDKMTKYEYYDQHFIGQEVYGSDGELAYSLKYILENGVPVSVDMYVKEGEKIDSVECTFDGFLNTSASYYAKGQLVLKEQNVFQNELLVERVLTGKDGEISHFYSQRDSIGRLTHRYLMINMDRDYSEDYTYDDNGFMTRYSRSGSLDGPIVDYTMDYTAIDSHGNWTERVIYQDHQPLYVQARTIVYY